MVLSRLDSEIMITAELVCAATYRISSTFGRRPLIFKWIRWIPFALKTFHLFEQDEWLFAFKLMSPECMSNT